MIYITLGYFQRILTVSWIIFYYCVCLLTAEAQQRLWAELKAGAESGWDFSSRWYIDSLNTNSGTLRDTQTSSILPVDLNAIMCRNERLLASFHRILGKENVYTGKPLVLIVLIKLVLDPVCGSLLFSSLLTLKNPQRFHKYCWWSGKSPFKDLSMTCYIKTSWVIYCAFGLGHVTMLEMLSWQLIHLDLPGWHVL